MAELYLGNSCFMLIVLLVLFFRIGSYIESSRSKKFALLFVGAVGLYVLLDALFMRAFLQDQQRNVTVFRVTVFTFYLVYVSMPYIWHLFMQSYIGISCTRSVRCLEAVPLCILLGMVISSVPTGIVWRISAEGVYDRGRFLMRLLL